MTEAVARILHEAEQLTDAEREELSDRLAEKLGQPISPEIERKQFNEVRRRIAQVEAGEVRLIPGDEAMEYVRRIVEAARSHK
jgi:hypothetical protein